VAAFLSWLDEEMKKPIQKDSRYETLPTTPRQTPRAPRG
jgi:hypothetical protein